VNTFPVELRQTPLGPDIAVGAVGAVCPRLPTAADAVAVQPLASVTVTEYVPGATAAKSSVVAPLLHAKVKGATPPLTVRFTDPLAEATHDEEVVVAEADTVQQFSLICPLQLSSTGVVHDSVTPGLIDALLSLQSALLLT